MISKIFSSKVFEILIKIFPLVIFSFSLWIFLGMIDDWGRLSGSIDNLFIFIEESLWPPDWSVIEPQAYPVCTTYPLFDFTCSTAWIGLIETLKIAFVSDRRHSRNLLAFFLAKKTNAQSICTFIF